VPTAWFVFFAVSPQFATQWYAGLLWAIAIVIFLAAIGYILTTLIRLLDTSGVTYSTKYRNRLIIIVAFVAMTGYLVGSFHQNFVSCEQFLDAGSAVPDNCASSEFWR
ncbi:MAG: hypothetical protein AAF485_22405, partial [Chloroflexota bacterium]